MKEEFRTWKSYSSAQYEYNWQLVRTFIFLEVFFVSNSDDSVI